MWSTAILVVLAVGLVVFVIVMARQGPILRWRRKSRDSRARQARRRVG